MKIKKSKNANYNCDPHSMHSAMGWGQMANMPENPIVMAFGSSIGCNDNSHVSLKKIPKEFRNTK